MRDVLIAWAVTVFLVIVFGFAIGNEIGFRMDYIKGCDDGVDVARTLQSRDIQAIRDQAVAEARQGATPPWLFLPTLPEVKL